MKYEPYISGWQLIFPKEGGDGGYKNRQEVFGKFMKFFRGEMLSLKLTGACALGGKVYGHSKFKDDTFIITADIAELKYIYSSTPKANCHDDMICATAKSGDEHYYFNSSMYNIFMTFMFHDFKKNGKLEEKPGAYLPVPLDDFI